MRIMGGSGQRVVNPAPLPAVLDESGPFQQREMLRHGRGGETQDRLDLADAQFASLEEFQDPGSCGVTGRFEGRFELAHDPISYISSYGEV